MIGSPNFKVFDTTKDFKKMKIFIRGFKLNTNKSSPVLLINSISSDSFKTILLFTVGSLKAVTVLLPTRNKSDFRTILSNKSINAETVKRKLGFCQAWEIVKGL